MRLVLAIAAALTASALAASEDKKAALIRAMQENGCIMTSAQAGVTMPALGIDRATAVALSREMMAEGIATFADNEETLLLLPPACKS